MTSLADVVALATVAFGLSVDEALDTATRGGAMALRTPDRGVAAEGVVADLVWWEAEHEATFAWNPGTAPRQVWPGGQPVL